MVTVIAAASMACARDDSITHGADGAPEWNRRLAAAIELGLPIDSARLVMERNGFRCELLTGDLWCDKKSGGRFAIVRRRWQATLAISDGRVRAIKATTGLIGP